MSLPRTVYGGVSTGPETPGGDGLIAYGPRTVTDVQQRVYDWRACPKDVQDEIISGVDGAEVWLSGVVILGGIKALLAGNGDHPIHDSRHARWHLEDCVIIGSGRRCPEAQDGTEVYMRRCWLHDWGSTFDVRAFGAWAHRGGKIVAEDCLFTQAGGRFSLGFNMVQDFVHHVGQAINDYGLAALLRPRTYLPGICRGLTADSGGLVLATRCYRNRPWIRIDNCDPFISRQAAIAIAERIDAAMPLHAYNYLGRSVLELFYAVTE